MQSEILEAELKLNAYICNTEFQLFQSSVHN